MLIFFFSSRRRHTRLQGDWSSDVCSSDLNKFVEFFGEGTASLTVQDRATIANMAPDYGATMGFFPVDDATIVYFEGTGRTKEETEALKSYFKAQGMYGTIRKGEIDYSQVVELDLAGVTPSLAGPN